MLHFSQRINLQDNLQRWSAYLNAGSPTKWMLALQKRQRIVSTLPSAGPLAPPVPLVPPLTPLTPLTPVRPTTSGVALDEELAPSPWVLLDVAFMLRVRPNPSE